MQHLLEAYQNLTDAACCYKLEEQEITLRLITKASANIQLFGNDEQIQMDYEFNKGYSARETVSLTKLLENLRSDLRKELKLQMTEQKLHWFKAEKKKQDGIMENSETASEN